MQGAGLRAQGSGSRVQGSGFRVQGSGFMVHGSCFIVHTSGFRVQGVGFGFQISKFQASGSGFRVQGAPSPCQIRPPPRQSRTPTGPATYSLHKRRRFVPEKQCAIVYPQKAQNTSTVNPCTPRRSLTNLPLALQTGTLCSGKGAYTTCTCCISTCVALFRYAAAPPPCRPRCVVTIARSLTT